jgi:hypothetical protein
MCQNAAERLQRESYLYQVSRNKGKRLKQFAPCHKGLVYTRECGDGNERPQMLVTMEAALTHCDAIRI